MIINIYIYIYTYTYRIKGPRDLDLKQPAIGFPKILTFNQIQS